MQLQCPLGTIQSRLARGRAKLKTRLEKSGRVLSSAFAAANHSDGLPSCPAPQAWAEATVRMAGQFATSKPARLRARPPSRWLFEYAASSPCPDGKSARQ